jgi:hypothetical protein
VSQARLAELLARWEEGQLSPEEASEIEGLLASGADLRQALVERDLLTVAIAQQLVLERDGAVPLERPPRRRAWIAGASAGLALAAAVVLVLRARGPAPERAGSPATATQALVLRGSAAAERAGQRRPLERASSLAPGDAVEVPTGAEVVVTRGPGVKLLVEAAEPTRFVVAAAAEGAWLRLETGALSGDIAPAAGVGPVVLVTGHARLAASAARLRVAVSQQETRIEVLTGAVDVRAVASGQALHVGAGEAVSIDAAGVFSSEPRGDRASKPGASGFVTAAERKRASREWTLLRAAPQALLERLAELRRARADAAMRRPDGSRCTGGQVAPGQMLIDGAVLRDRALVELGQGLIGATFEREAMGGRGGDAVFCLAHWVGDLAHAALVLRDADDPAWPAREAEELTQSLRRSAQRLADPAQARDLHAMRGTPAYAIAAGAALGLAGQALGDAGMRARGRELIGRALARQRSDGAFLMGTPPGHDTEYQAMGLWRLSWWLLGDNDDEAVAQAFDRGALWLLARVGPGGELDGSENVKSRGCAPGAICRGKHDEEIAWSLLYHGLLHDPSGLDAATRFLDARAPRRR